MRKQSLDTLDRPDVTAILFHPRREVGLPRLAANVHSLRIPVDGDTHVGAKIFVGRPGAPVVLYFHGNGEIASDYEPIAPFYTRMGLTLFVFDYRGYGTSDGSPSATALLDDAWACWEHTGEALRAKGIDVGPLYVMGRSLGSAAALEVAARAGANLAGLILESAFADTFALIERIGFLTVADVDEARDGFGNLRKISEVDAPTLVLHGERDWIIPVSDGQALYEASPAEHKSIVTVPGAGHNDLMMVGRSDYFGSIGRLCGIDPDAI